MELCYPGNRNCTHTNFDRSGLGHFTQTSRCSLCSCRLYLCDALLNNFYRSSYSQEKITKSPEFNLVFLSIIVDIKVPEVLAVQLLCLVIWARISFQLADTLYQTPPLVLLEEIHSGRHEKGCYDCCMFVAYSYSLPVNT